MNRFINEEPTLIESSTVSVDLFSETFKVNDGTYINVNIYDTAGAEKYDSQTFNYYKKADCVVLVYDVTNEESFEACKTYVQRIKDNCKEDIQVILLGNKTDLKEQRKVSEDDGIKFADKYHYLFKETSCGLNYNVADAFESIIIMTNNDMIKNKTNISSSKTTSIVINKETIQDKDKDNKWCC